MWLGMGQAAQHGRVTVMVGSCMQPVGQGLELSVIIIQSTIVVGGFVHINVCNSLVRLTILL